MRRHGDRVLEGRAGRADRGRAVRRRPQAQPALGRLPWEQADPLTTFDLKRFNAVRGYQAQQGREISRCLKELRQLRRERARGMHGRTRGAASQNEPEEPAAPANDDAPAPRATADSAARKRCRTNPSGRADRWDELPERRPAPSSTACSPPTTGRASRGSPPPAPFCRSGLGPADLASPAALGRALFRPAGQPAGPAALTAGRPGQADRRPVTPRRPWTPAPGHGRYHPAGATRGPGAAGRLP